MADVLLSSVVGGGRSIPASINGLVGDGLFSQLITAQANASGALATPIGSTTANTYKTLLDISVSGTLLLCAVARGDTTSRRVGLKVTIDGTVFYEVYDLDGVANGRGPVAAGVFGTQSASHSHYNFNSLKVEAKSSLTETNKVISYIVYTLDA